MLPASTVKLIGDEASSKSLGLGAVIDIPPC